MLRQGLGLKQKQVHQNILLFLPQVLTTNKQGKICKGLRTQMFGSASGESLGILGLCEGRTEIEVTAFK